MAAADIVIGAYYEIPDGRVVRTHGWNGKAQEVSYQLEDGPVGLTVAAAALTATWTLRPDLADFPNARDPRVPHVFDLFWDVKRRSGLVALVASGVDEAEVRDAMASHSVELTEAEMLAVEELRGSLAPPPGP